MSHNKFGGKLNLYINKLQLFEGYNVFVILYNPKHTFYLVLHDFFLTPVYQI